VKGLEGIPVVASEFAPRESAIVIGMVVVLHPLLIIEIECGDDLNLRSARALEWIQRRATRHADAAMKRLDGMYAEPRAAMEVALGPVLTRAVHRMEEQILGAGDVWPSSHEEGTYRWPDIEEAVGARA